MQLLGLTTRRCFTLNAEMAKWRCSEWSIFVKELSFLLSSSCLRRTSDEAQWHHNHPRLAQRVPSKQKLRVASDRTKPVQNLCEVWVFWIGRQWSKWAMLNVSFPCFENPQGQSDKLKRKRRTRRDAFIQMSSSFLHCSFLQVLSGLL